MTYVKSELVAEVKNVIENQYERFQSELEIEEIEVRLQLFDGSYQVWTGDSSYDTDHRGYWGSGSIVFDRTLLHNEDNVLVAIVVEDINAEEIATWIVEGAISELLENGEEYRDIYNIAPLETAYVRELDSELEFTDNSEDIASTLEMIGISDLDNEVGSIYWEYCEGEIGEVWVLSSNVPALNAVAKRIR